MSYKQLTERGRQVLLGLLLRYAEHTRERTLERAARAIIDNLT